MSTISIEVDSESARAFSNRRGPSQAGIATSLALREFNILASTAAVANHGRNEPRGGKTRPHTGNPGFAVEWTPRCFGGGRFHKHLTPCGQRGPILISDATIEELESVLRRPQRWSRKPYGHGQFQFLALNPFRGISILRPRELLDSITQLSVILFNSSPLTTTENCPANTSTKSPISPKSTGRRVLKNIWLSFYPARKSASSARTGPAKARSCESWPGRIWNSTAKQEPFPKRGRRHPLCLRPHTQPRRCPSRAPRSSSDALCPPKSRRSRSASRASISAGYNAARGVPVESPRPAGPNSRPKWWAAAWIVMCRDSSNT